MTDIDKKFTNLINSTIEQLSATSDDDKRWEIANKLVAHFGGTALGVVTTTSANSINLLRSSMSHQWLDEYTGEKYYEVDPVILNMPLENKFQIRATGSLKNSPTASRRMIDFDQGLADSGHNSMLSANFNTNFNRDHKLIVIASDITVNEFSKILPDRHVQHLMAIIAAYIAVPRDGTLKGVSNFGGNILSMRDREALSWLAAGLQNAEIAEKMNVAEITVRKRLAVIRNKLGAKTRDQALAIAIRDGYFWF